MNTKTSYHLRYFNLRARGEPIRWILRAVNADFTEERIDMADWAKLKKEFNFGKCPILIINGTQLHQTIVICKYLARCHNLAPSNPWQVARLEEIVECVHDISEYFAIAFMARLHQNSSRMSHFIDKAKTRAYEVALLLEAQITQQGWLRSEKMTFADLITACYFDIFEGYFPDVLDKCPKLRKLLNNIKNIPAIKDWLITRPPLQPFEIIDNSTLS